MNAVPILAIVLILIVLLAIACARAAVGRASPPSPPLDDSALGAMAGVEKKLAALVRRPTVSRYDRSLEHDEHFAALIDDLAEIFPYVHASLERAAIGDRALLYTWKGRDPSKAPAILCAHFDVVPADDVDQWKRPPFSGEISEGFVWGRGTQDSKGTLVSILYSAERLLARGFRPERTIFFAFGGDEEVGGLRGAAAIGATLRERGIKASFLLDEGGPVTDGMLRFVDRPIALVGIAEKGYMDIALEAVGPGGHAAMPPRRTAAGDLARAVAAVEARRERARLTYSARALLTAVSRYSGFGYRLLFKNLWLTAPIVKAALSASGTTNALIRTTAAPTMLEGSAQANVLADKARAILNTRILPGDSSAAVLERIARIAARFGARATAAHEAAVVEPSPESPVDHEGYRAIEAALAASFPDAACVPFLLSGGTDAKHYHGLAQAAYRMTPLRQTNADLAGIHGRDERVAVADLRRCSKFYEALLKEV